LGCNWNIVDGATYPLLRWE